MKRSVGIIGLGNAGAAISKAFIKKITVFGYDSDPVQRENAQALGVKCVPSVSDISRHTNHIILSLPKPEISLAVTKQLTSCESGPDLVIETSTVTPQTVIECQSICADQKIAFVDAAIAGGVASMAAGEITFFLGGSDSDKEKAKPILTLVADRIYDLGAIGVGMGAKVVNNGVMHALMGILIEAFSMSKKLDIPSQIMIDILNREEGLLRPLVHRVKERMQNGNYQGGMSVTNARKDSILALETAQQLGVPLFATLAAHTPYEIAESRRMGDLDYASLATLWEEWANIDFKVNNTR